MLYIYYLHTWRRYRLKEFAFGFIYEERSNEKLSHEASAIMNTQKLKRRIIFALKALDSSLARLPCPESFNCLKPSSSIGDESDLLLLIAGASRIGNRLKYLFWINISLSASSQPLSSRCRPKTKIKSSYPTMPTFLIAFSTWHLLLRMRD